MFEKIFTTALAIILIIFLILTVLYLLILGIESSIEERRLNKIISELALKDSKYIDPHTKKPYTYFQLPLKQRPEIHQIYRSIYRTRYITLPNIYQYRKAMTEAKKGLKEEIKNDMKKAEEDMEKHKKVGW